MPNAAAWMERFFKLHPVVKRLGNVKFCAKAIKPNLTAPAPKV